MNEVVRTKGGRVLTEEDLQQLAAEAERGYCAEPRPDDRVICNYAPCHEGRHSWERSE